MFLHISGFGPFLLLLYVTVWVKKDDLGEPRAHWQKTAVCPSSRSALRCPGTLPARRSGPQRGGTIWYQLPSSRGASVPSFLLSVKVMLATWSRAVPIAAWLASMSRSYPSCHSGEGLCDLETGRAPPSRCAADCLWEDGWRHTLCSLCLNEACAAWVELAVTRFLHTLCPHCGQVDWEYCKNVCRLSAVYQQQPPLLVMMHLHRTLVQIVA